MSIDAAAREICSAFDGNGSGWCDHYQERIANILRKHFPAEPAAGEGSVEQVVQMLVNVNAVHKKKGTVLGKETWHVLLDHLHEECKEFDEAICLGGTKDARVSELADIYGLVVHAAVKLGVTMREVERQEVRKLKERFEPWPDFSPAAGEGEAAYRPSTSVGPTDRPACPHCGNSFQNGVPDGHPELLRCASCKHIFLNHLFTPSEPITAVPAGLEAENERLQAEVERLKAKSRKACQILVEAVGADGPCDVDEAAMRAVSRLQAENAALRALQYAVGTHSESLPKEIADAWTDSAAYRADTLKRQRERIEELESAIRKAVWQLRHSRTPNIDELKGLLYPGG